jgi:hypothetical protein
MILIMTMTSSAGDPPFFTTTRYIIRFKNFLCNKYMLYTSLVTIAYSDWWQQPPSTAKAVMTQNKQLWST